jgi:hypothetical protein
MRWRPKSGVSRQIIVSKYGIPYGTLQPRLAGIPTGLAFDHLSWGAKCGQLEPFSAGVFPASNLLKRSPFCAVASCRNFSRALEMFRERFVDILRL